MNKSPMLLLLVAVVALAPLGCVSSDSVALGSKTYPPRDQYHNVDVYVSEEAPATLLKEYKEGKPIADLPKDAKLIGRVDVTFDSPSNWNQIVGTAKRRARELGGDAITIGNGAPTDLFTGTSGTIAAKVYRYGD